MARCCLRIALARSRSVPWPSCTIAPGPRIRPLFWTRCCSTARGACLTWGVERGIASALLAARGCEVLGVEVDVRMAAVARRKDLEVEVAAFERWADRGRRFDLVVSGQAWHWIDPVSGAAKAAAVLCEGGRIGVFWNFGDPPPEVRERLAPIYARLEPELENSARRGPGRSPAHGWASPKRCTRNGGPG